MCARLVTQNEKGLWSVHPFYIGVLVYRSRHQNSQALCQKALVQLRYCLFDCFSVAFFLQYGVIVAVVINIVYLLYLQARPHYTVSRVIVLVRYLFSLAQ